MSNARSINACAWVGSVAAMLACVAVQPWLAGPALGAAFLASFLACLGLSLVGLRLEAHK